MDSNEPLVARLVRELREFKGIARKSALGDLLPILDERIFDDAGVLEAKGFKIVVSTDGIVESLVRDDPWLAGFYSVVVNANDVVAKGARPLGYVHVLSSSSPKVRKKVVLGIKHGINKYGLRFLKGHTHPDTSYDAIDAAVLGLAHNILSSANAHPNDSIIVAIDMDGKLGLKGWVRTFDSVRLKPKADVLACVEAIIKIADRKLADTCRDISGPGIVGTITMLCESSHVGATIIIDDIPKPKVVNINDWLMTYPSTGFVFTTSEPTKCINILKKHGFTADVVGTVSKKKEVKISLEGQVNTFMNLEKESIFGLRLLD